MANERRRGNFISSLTVKGIRLEKDELKEGIGSYFKAMIEEPQARRPVVASKLLMRIDNMDYEGLEGPILEEEVTKAMSGLGDDKAPGTDGFSLAFWKFTLVYSKWGSDAGIRGIPFA